MKVKRVQSHNYNQLNSSQYFNELSVMELENDEQTILSHAIAGVVLLVFFIRQPGKIARSGILPHPQSCTS